MKNTNSQTEHSKRLRGSTANEAQKEAIKNGGFKLTALIIDKEVAEFARNKIPNKRQFILEAVKKAMNEWKLKNAG